MKIRSLLSSLLPRPVAAALLGAALLGAGAVARAQTESRTAATPPPPSLPYRILHNDTIGVQVFGEEDLTHRERVNANGDITPVLLPPIDVGNLTLAEAEKVIEDAYRNGHFLVHPVVTLNVEDYAPREVSVSGAVKTPGRYPLPIESTITLIDIITKAGLDPSIAAGNRVKVTRYGPEGASPHVFTVDVESVLRGKEKDPQKIEAAHMLLEPGDIIYVPESVI